MKNAPRNKIDTGVENASTEIDQIIAATTLNTHPQPIKILKPYQMKNVSFFFTPTLILLLGFQISLSAQKTATWKGGAPGRNTAWNCATNWKEGRVPNEFSNVIITDVSTTTFCYPVIEEGEVVILSLLCTPPAMLTIGKNASLIVIESFENREINQNKGLANLQNHRDSVIMQKN